MLPKIEFTSDGRVKDFSVSDAHSFFITAYQNLGNGKEKLLRKESMILPDLDYLYKLHQVKDPEDGYILGEKWHITSEVIKQLLSKGECESFLPGHPIKYRYFIRKTHHADNLKAK